MKNKLFLAAALTAAMAGGCQKAPQVRAEYASDVDAEVGCATFVRESVDETLDFRPADPLHKEISELDGELRGRIYDACMRHHEVTGQYPGME